MRWTSILLLGLLGCGGSDDPVAADSATADTFVADTFVADTFVADSFVAETTEAGPACVDPPVGSVVKVTVDELKTVIDSGAKIAVIDVREPSETAKGVIAGALLYPWIGGALKAKHAELPTDKPLYVLCASGTRSAQATDWLSKNGHACVHDTQGGMNAWTASKYPTVMP